MENLLFLDTEATGTEAEDRLCQVAYRYQGKDTNELFKPPVPVKLAAMAVHHITEKQLADQPSFDGSPTKAELQILSDGAVFVAHNAKYDLGMLEKEGVTFPKHICTLKVARHIGQGRMYESHQLQYLRYYYGLEIEAVAHDAFGDILVLEAVFDKLYYELHRMEFHDTPPQAAPIIDRMIEISSQPSLYYSISFGKYAGQRLDAIARKDKDYLQWLLAQKRLKPEDEEDWIYSLEHYIKT